MVHKHMPCLNLGTCCLMNVNLEPASVLKQNDANRYLLMKVMCCLSLGSVLRLLIAQNNENGTMQKVILFLVISSSISLYYEKQCTVRGNTVCTIISSTGYNNNKQHM